MMIVSQEDRTDDQNTRIHCYYGPQMYRISALGKIARETSIHNNLLAKLTAVDYMHRI